MGVDWLYRASKTFNSALDKREVALRTPTLLSPQIKIENRTICGDVVKNASFVQGEKLLLRVFENRLVAQRENKVVAEFTNSKKEDVERVRKYCAEVVEVTAVNPLSCTVEVSIAP